MEDEIVTFTRRRDLRFVRELGSGACGRTVLLHDDVIDEEFVCKKYAPFVPSLQEELFSNFVREIKILHLLNHQNIVRVFSYYLYPEKLTGYILMERVNGEDIEEYLANHPEHANSIFLQVLNGFEHLERCGILHRDIRPQNILVTYDGVAKIIDFGFGKRVDSGAGFEKSISLNWWCEPPGEFAAGKYSHATDIYFIGKLFEKIVVESGVSDFGYKDALTRMCQMNPDKRVGSFAEVRQQIAAGKIAEIGFTDDELVTYRIFAASLSGAITKIEKGTKYHPVIEVEKKLGALYQRTMLEAALPSNAALASCFINGSFYYSRTQIVPVSQVKGLLDLLRVSGRDRKEIIVSNLQERLDSILRYEDVTPDDIPF